MLPTCDGIISMWGLDHVGHLLVTRNRVAVNNLIEHITAIPAARRTRGHAIGIATDGDRIVGASARALGFGALKNTIVAFCDRQSPSGDLSRLRSINRLDARPRAHDKHHAAGEHQHQCRNRVLHRRALVFGEVRVSTTGAARHPKTNLASDAGKVKVKRKI